MGATSTNTPSVVYDYVVIGSGFGGSVSAMRLAEKGYSVCVLERGKRYADEDFPKTNWNVFKYLWAPAVRCFGIQVMSLLGNVLVLHGSGVGGGSLIYANVLLEPGDAMFNAPAWHHLADWKAVLRPHYDTARKMLGVERNPRLWPADHALKAVAEDLGTAHTFQPADVGVFFGDPNREGELVNDPYFDGEGPSRRGCIHCGGCMVGCRHNAKNMLTKNYLYLAEKKGAKIQPESDVVDIVPVGNGDEGSARYEVIYRRSTGWPTKPEKSIRARNVVVSAGVIGTLSVLYHCRDISGTLKRLSPRLGEQVRTNSEALLGVTAFDKDIDYSEGVAITSFIKADDVTAVEPVRFAPGSGFMRMLAAPMIEAGGSGFLVRLVKAVMEGLRHPIGFLHSRFFSRWPLRTTILLVMQTRDTLMQVRQGRSWSTFFRRGLVTIQDSDNPIIAEVPLAHDVTRRFADKVGTIPLSAVNESLFNIATTAHILGGVPFGRDDQEGVIGLNCEVHNYPGLYVVDGSIMPANPGVNPSLTITALAEYAMSHISRKT